MRRPLLVLLALAGCPVGPSSNPPDPDSCDTPTPRAVAGVELGDRDEETFRPLAENAVVGLVWGGQGSPMLPLRLRVSGTDLPECLAQTTRVVSPTEGPLGLSSSPLRTYAEPDGSRATKANYLVLDFSPGSGQPIVVTVEAGGVTLTRTLWINEFTGADAGLPGAAGG